MRAKRPFEMPHEGNELMRTARRKIDDEISELESKNQSPKTECRIQSLRTKRNELSLIFALPFEVLSKIFIFVRNSSVDGRFCKRHAYWIRVGHICHHWRKAALSCPSLWSIPAFTRPRLAQEMIQRSKMAPLTIRSIETTWTPKMLGQLKSTLAHISRIRSIELTVQNYTNELITIYSLFSQPAPLLEFISLSGPVYNNPFPLPVDTLYDAPSLRSINFHSLNISWECAIFKHRNLTDLRLKKNNAALNGTSTMAQMMDALHQLPNLRTLELHDSVPSHTTSKGNQKTVEFKFLERFELFAKAADCIFLLRHIHYPSQTMTTLRSSSTGIEDSMAILSLLGEHLCDTQSSEAGIPHSPVVIRSAQLSCPEPGGVEITLSNAADGIDSLSIPGGLESSSPIVRIRLVGDCAAAQLHIRLLMSVCNCFDLSSLKYVLLDWNFTDDHIAALRDSFKKFPKLKIINVSRSLLEICLAIAGNLGDEKPKSKQQKGVASQHSFPPVTVLPALRIFIVGVSLLSSRRSEDLEHLTNMLVKRSNHNASINKLSFESSKVRTWQKRILGELVVKLEVGGELIEDVEELVSGESDCSDSDEDEDEIDVIEDEDRYSDDTFFSLNTPWL